MEERGPPPSADDDASSNSNDDPSSLSNTQIVPLHRPPPSETYVIQIPKDQIYRVPPPENAQIFERHRNPETKKKSSCCEARCMTVGAIVFLIVLVAGITLLSLSLTIKPKPPTFSITDVHVKNPKTKSSSSSLHPSYEVSLKVKNPNGNAITYGKNEEAFLSFMDKIIGKGKFPLKSQGGDSLAAAKLVLEGSKRALPREVEKSMGDAETDVRVPLGLKMDVTTKVKGFIKTWEMETKVECDFKVSTLRKGTKVVQQKCEAEFKG